MAAQHAGGAYATRYKFNGKELDPETGYYYYGARYYDPVVSRWLSIDPLAEKYPGLSPYNYTANNPVMLVDSDGKVPILPLIFKAGANAAADWLLQTAMNYFFNPATARDLEKSMMDVNGWQVFRSGLEGLIPWKTPGGRLGRAALTATGDVMVNWAHYGSEYTTEQALKDFAVGFISDLGGGELGMLINKYGGKAVARGFQWLGLDVPEQVLHSIETGLLETPFSASRNISFRSRQLQKKFYHARDFGIIGNYNPANAAKFKSAIEAHIRDVNTVAIPGTYRGTIKGTHYYNSKTRLWVFKDENGQFLTGWRLGNNQREDLLINSNVQ